MQINLEEYNIYIRPGVTDMRKRGEGLSLLIQAEMSIDPYSKSIFLFCGRSRKRITAIVWNENGWLEISKKLECGMTYMWPKDKTTAVDVSFEDVKEMLKGGNPFRRFGAFQGMSKAVKNQ